MKWYFVLFFILSVGNSFNFMQARCVSYSCQVGDKTCYGLPRKISQIDVRDFNEMSYCYKVEVPGIVADLRAGEDTCVCQGANQASHYLLFIQNPADLNYPCSPVMLEYFKKKREQKEAQCKQFKKRLEC